MRRLFIEGKKLFITVGCKIDWSVRDLSDGIMIQMMARENNDVYGANFQALLESVRTAVTAYANDQIYEEEMPVPLIVERSRSDNFRFAPSFVTRSGSAPDPLGRPYTAISLATFLGMTKRGGSAGVIATETLRVSIAGAKSPEVAYRNVATRQAIGISP
jgi:hypothetical protein